MRLAQLALPTDLVADDAGELGALDVDPRRAGARLGRIDQGRGVAEVGLDPRSRRRALGREEHARPGEEREDLEKAHAALSREGDRGLGSRARLVGMPGAETYAGKGREVARLEAQADATSAHDGQGAVGGLCRLGPLPSEDVSPREGAQRPRPKDPAPGRLGDLDRLPGLLETGVGVAEYLVHIYGQRVRVHGRLRVPALPRDLDRPLNHVRAVQGAPEPRGCRTAGSQRHAVRAEPRDVRTA